MVWRSCEEEREEEEEGGEGEGWVRDGGLDHWITTLKEERETERRITMYIQKIPLQSAEEKLEIKPWPNFHS